MPDTMSCYILITPVRDEEALLPRTIASVVAQTVLPAEWIIVSDGSTDGTDEIVREASARHPWIRLLALAPRPARSFAAVVRNTETAIRNLNVKQPAFLGLLDADIEFQSDYFEQLMARFEVEPGLGLAGGVVIDVGRARDRFPRNRRDVPGAVQFFRRECFERIGGLTPMPEGGWDMITCATARMHGFTTRLFTDLVVDHLKPRNIAEGGAVRRKWQLGIRDYAAGYHPLFEVVKCISRWKDPPFVIGAVAWWVGYCTAVFQRRQRMVDASLVTHVRHEQLSRLGRLLVPWPSQRSALNPK
ncbi:MAG: glycosyltransferase family A protein [Verrucomicrobiota bacterium]